MLWYYFLILPDRLWANVTAGHGKDICVKDQGGKSSRCASGRVTWHLCTGSGCKPAAKSSKTIQQSHPTGIIILRAAHCTEVRKQTYSISSVISDVSVRATPSRTSQSLLRWVLKVHGWLPEQLQCSFAWTLQASWTQPEGWAPYITFIPGALQGFLPLLRTYTHTPTPASYHTGRWSGNRGQFGIQCLAPKHFHMRALRQKKPE